MTEFTASPDYLAASRIIDCHHPAVVAKAAELAAALNPEAGLDYLQQSTLPTYRKEEVLREGMRPTVIEEMSTTGLNMNIGPEGVKWKYKQRAEFARVRGGERGRVVRREGDVGEVPLPRGGRLQDAQLPVFRAGVSARR